MTPPFCLCLILLNMSEAATIVIANWIVEPVRGVLEKRRDKV